MRLRRFKIALPPAALSIALLGASAAMAAPEPSQGDTSGPAAGTDTAQSAAVQKNANQWNDGRSEGESMPGAEIRCATAIFCGF